MLSLILRRLVEGILVLLAASFITFALLDHVPGDIAQVLVGDAGTLADIEKIQKDYGFDQPLLSRYINYLGRIITAGDFGKSFISGREVSVVLKDKFRNTLILAISATVLSSIVGIFLGRAAARNRGGGLDSLITGGLSVVLAIPGFLLALILVWIFSLKLGWLPVSSGNTLRYMILPCMTLTFPMSAIIARISRASIRDVSDREYVLTARAKGIPKELLWNRHILRNALLPILHFTGVHFGHLLGGAFIVETIYGWPGLGRQIVLSILEHDYPIVIASVLLVALSFQIIHFSLDLLHGYLDPRSRRHA